MSLGQRIKFFRTRAGMSQLELEVLTSLAEGSLSRIEHNLINPTKETVTKISDQLQLSPRELDYLIGISSKPLTQNDIELAKKEVETFFRKAGVAAYLLDEKWRFIDVSDFFIRALGLTEDEKRIFHG